MKKIILGLSALVIILLATNLNLNAQAKGTGIGIGIVDVEAIVKEMPEAISADKQLADLRKSFEDTVTTKTKSLDDKLQAYQKQKSMMAIDKQQSEEANLQKEYQDIQVYRQEKQEALTNKREELLTPIRNKVKKAVEAVAQEEKVSVVLTKDAASTVLYFDSKLDLTFRVIDKIKRNK